MEAVLHAGGDQAVLQLIALVQQNTRLWDRTAPDFITQVDLKLDHFAWIAEKLSIDVSGDVVSACWRELSEKYRRRLYDGKRRNGTTSWPFFEAMAFLKEQYELGRWQRSTSSTSSPHSPPPANVAQLVSSILHAHTQHTEHALSTECNKKQDHLMTAAFQLFSTQQERTNTTPCVDVFDVDSQALPLAPVPCHVSPQPPTARYKHRHTAYSRKHCKQKASTASSAVSSVKSAECTSATSTNEVQTAQSASNVQPEGSASSSEESAGNVQRCAVQTEASQWDNVGRVWVDMMNSVRCPQLALAAHKFITNSLFAVLEADQQLIGTDPASTRVRIHDIPPHIEIMHL